MCQNILADHGLDFLGCKQCKSANLVGILMSEWRSAPGCRKLVLRLRCYQDNNASDGKYTPTERFPEIRRSLRSKYRSQTIPLSKTIPLQPHNRLFLYSLYFITDPPRSIASLALQLTRAGSIFLTSCQAKWSNQKPVR